GLERDHQDVEDRPAGTGDDRAEEGQQAAGSTADAAHVHDVVAASRAQQGDQQEYQLAGIHVAEQAHGQAHRLGQVFDDVEAEVRRRQDDLHDRAMGMEGRGEQFLGEAEATLGLDRKGDHQDQHRHRHRQGDVEVGGGHGAEVLGAGRVGDARRDVDRDELDGVHQQDPDEHRQRQRGDEAAVAVEDIADLGVDELDGQLDEGLQLAGHAGGGATADPPEQAQAEDADGQRHQQGIDVDGPEA